MGKRPTLAAQAGKPRSPALAAALETAQDLADLGVISKRTLRGYRDECLQAQAPADDPVRVRSKRRSAMRPEDVARIRAKVRASQGYFARQLQVSASTVQQWESGMKTPSPMAAKLLQIVDKYGLEVLA